MSSQHLRSDAGSRSYSVGLLWIPIWLVFFGRTVDYLLSHPLNKRRGESCSLLHLPSRSQFDISQPTPNNIPWASGLNIPQNDTILPCARLGHAGITLRSEFYGPFLHTYFCCTTIISQKSHPLPHIVGYSNADISTSMLSNHCVVTHRIRPITFCIWSVALHTKIAYDSLLKLAHTATRFSCLNKWTHSSSYRLAL